MESGTGKVDFHFGERSFNESFDFSMTQKTITELGSETPVVGSDLENQGPGNKLEYGSSEWIVDSLKTQTAFAELGSGTSAGGSDLESQEHGNELENLGFDWIGDSLKTQKAFAELGSGTSAVGSDLESQELGNKLENVGFDWIKDSLKTQKALAELGSGASGVVSDLENQWEGNPQENGGSYRNVDSLETQEVVGEYTAVFAAELALGFCKNQERNCGHGEEKPDIDYSSNAAAADANGSLESRWKDRVSPDFGGVLVSLETQEAVPRSNSQNGALDAGLEYCNCQSNLQSSQTRDWKRCSENITESPMEKNDTDLQSSKRQSSKPVNEKIPVSAAEGEMVLETKIDIASAFEKESPMTGPPSENHFRKHLEKVEFERVPAFQTSDNIASATDKEAILNAKSASTKLLHDHNSQKSSDYDQLEGYPKDKEPVISATIAKLGCENASGSLDFDKLSASPIGKDFISNGFIVKKLQRKQLGDNSMEFEEFEITIPPGSALLFPSKRAIGLEAVDFKVKHLIVLDGTWAKARRMYHENPWLNLLPHLKLDPREVSLYSEVRHQPKAGCLSTIESIVCALKALGDASVGLDDLLQVFESMVGDQRRCKVDRLSKLSLA